VIVCGTGPIVAGALTGLQLAGHTLLVPGKVVAEVGYMLARESGV
jgi:hypothetical protein